ncbi:MAG: nucleotidyl transferase AbiEii/AbiGii toxin family protein [Lachnospiraceae bacterium]|nr:nucleotidyl transferase AbiEii/AbiGii toxin family protein [Lachnospiraceae bacterium]
MYLHNDKQLLEDVVNAASEAYGIETAIIEKDYYVTMILKSLALENDKIVFKGGTSLSKCYQVINRFSEDIDITFSEHIGESRRKKLKYNVMKLISDELELPISNWDKIESDKDLNQYRFSYEPIAEGYRDSMLPVVKVETALRSYAFPVEKHEVTSYIYQYLAKEEEQELIQEYGLEPFLMNVQSLERTYIDKVFALCDYYMQGKSKRYSRHLYDLFKLQNQIVFDDNFKRLIIEVREHRQKLGSEMCPSAQPGIILSEKINAFIDEDFYKTDYDAITEYFIRDMVSYDDTIKNMQLIANSTLF